MNRSLDKTIEKMLNRADQKEIGMTLISAATGKGKTTQVINYAIDSINSGRYKKVVIIEPRHSILSEVKEKLESIAECKVLYLNSAVENAKRYIDGVKIDSIKDKIIKEKLKKLKDLLSDIDNFDGVKRKTFEEEAFRTKSELKKYCIENKKAIKDDYTEVSKIFPENIKESSPYILMTMDKVFYTLDTLEKDNRILSKKIFNKETLVVIDELDKCYGIALKKSSENKDNLDDLISIIQSAYKFISSDDTRWQRINNEEINAKIEIERKNVIDEIERLNDQYGILNNFVFRCPNEEKIELFVSRKQTFVAGKNQNYKLTIKNNTTTLEKCINETNFSVVKMAIACKEVIRKILNLVYDLSEGYMLDREDATYEDGLLFGISQTLNRTTSESSHYLNYARNNTIKTQALRIAKGEYVNDMSVCNNGFSHCVFENRPGTNHTYVTSLGIDLTPENIFVWISKNSNVIGLSATQQIPTTLSLDLDYVKDVIGENFDCYSREDFAIANSNINQTTQNLHCDIVRSFRDDEDLINRIQKTLIEENDESSERIPNVINEYLDSIRKQTESNLIDRECKRFYAINEFLLRKNAISGIIILNSNYRYINELKSYICSLKNQCKVDTIEENNIYKISADNIEDKIYEIQEKLNKGIKCLIISNKEALGQGVNIQYDRDFNFFYQEDPTYVYPVISKDKPLDKEDVNRYIYLVMKMASNGEISSAAMRQWITSIITGRNHEFRSFKSVKNAKTSIFIQGLGRANRNSDKEEHEYILFDEDLCDSLDLENIQVEKTQELVAVEERIKQYKKDEMYELQNSLSKEEKELCDNSNNLQKIVSQLLDTFTKENMHLDRVKAFEEYNKIRENIIKYGLWFEVNNESDLKELKQLGYVQVNQPYERLYIRSADDKYCENLQVVSFSKLHKLDELDFKSVTNIKSYKKPTGNCWLINPKAFNILQGAIGEKKFKELFEDETGYKLEELPLEENEICGDFKVKDTNIYIDVKNFSEEGGTRDITEFAVDKLEKIKEHNPDGMLIIVNVFAKEKYSNVNDSFKDILTISNVIGERGVKYTENIRKIENWIDENT
ncbi:MAG: DEAD/DEAH box helicase family protein [Clostridia bacterium]|nr:DEAD/DEAH box helicase family protein [Clostridia bacterium]